jgi:hypothetical protein
VIVIPFPFESVNDVMQLFALFGRKSTSTLTNVANDVGVLVTVNGVASSVSPLNVSGNEYVAKVAMITVRSR